MTRLFILVLVCCVLLTACGTPEQPAAPEPPVAQQAPTVAPAQPPDADVQPATDNAVPNATPQPRGKRLREVWPIAANKQPAVTTLLYSDVLPVDDDETRARTAAFWQTTVQSGADPKPIMTIPIPPLGDAAPFYGELSPNGDYIAYMVRLGDSGAELHIVQQDGSNDRLIAAPIASTVGHNLHRFAWSPDSSQLAFIKYGEKGQEFYVYDVQTAAPPKLIAQVGGADLAGWRDAKSVLVYLVTDQQRPLQITAINTENLAQEALAELPRIGSVFTLMSPDNSQIVMSEYLFNVKTRQFRELNVEHGRWLWSPDGKTLVDSPNARSGMAKLVGVDTQGKRSDVSLITPPDSDVNYDILSISPDQRYLAVCEKRTVSSTSALVRTLLYDVSNDTWTPIGERPFCLQVLGWQ